MTIDPRDLKRMADDSGLPETTIRVLARANDETPMLLNAMLAEQHLDLATIAAADPWTAQDIARTCTECTAHGRCFRELALGTAAENAEAFCPNAERFDELKAES